MAIKFRPLIPALVNPKAFNRATDNILDFAEQQFKRDFKITIRGWHEPVTFKTKKIIRIRLAKLQYFTNNLIYFFVSEGTKAHDIKAKRAPKLVFKSGYIPLSKPGFLSYSASATRFGSTVFADKVRHPGIEPRKFGDMVADKNRKPIEKKAKEEFKEAAERSQIRGVR